MVVCGGGRKWFVDRRTLNDAEGRQTNAKTNESEKDKMQFRK